MSNPWETRNPWGKGSKEWNRWMAPEKVEEVTKRTSGGRREDAIPALADTYIDELGLLLYDNETNLKQNVRTILRKDGLAIRRSQVSGDEKVKALLAKSRPLTFESAEIQTSFALDLLTRSKEIMTELVCYVSYNYQESRIRIVEEKDIKDNTQFKSFGNFTKTDTPKIISPVGPALHFFIQGDMDELVIGTIHTHPTSEDSVMSADDYRSNAITFLPVIAIQDKKVLYLKVSSFTSEQTHLLANGPFDFIRFSLENYIKSRLYAQ
jgi:hypothetical protein